MLGEQTRIRLLGPITVTIEGREVQLGSPRQLALFATLAANVNRVVSREELVDAVWGLEAPATAINSVYTYVARLRNALEPSRPQRTPSRRLLSEGDGYLLALPDSHVDLRTFEAHLAEARRLQTTAALHSALGELDSALAMWRGTPFSGAAGPFITTERTRLTELRLAAMEGRAELLLELGQHAELVGELFGLARRHPLRERLRLQLMQCYLRLGRQADALTEYHDLRATLADELGIGPSEELQELYYNVLIPRGASTTASCALAAASM
ncbi:BTAD domain-containing putative transcriptional regulator, partial [Dactylosporangium sp. NPDC005572]|uniref:AfsR/SARP family transcriptional regulator n=1 Tax=Dactylosporangium sp. NPDC005572 TaxID=3156889 RepID=UPI0033AF9041